jgi:hypothetical protein
MAKLSDIKPIPLKSLLRKKAGSTTELAAAAVIIAQDVNTGSRVVAFGRELLEDLARAKARHALKVLIIEVDFESEDLQRLLTLIDSVKGTPDTAAG